MNRRSFLTLPVIGLIARYFPGLRIEPEQQIDHLRLSSVARYTDAWTPPNATMWYQPDERWIVRSADGRIVEWRDSLGGPSLRSPQPETQPQIHA